MAANVMSMVKEVWVSLTCYFSCDVLACGDAGCLCLRLSLPAAHMACGETGVLLSMPWAGL